MTTAAGASAATNIRRHAYPLTGSAGEYDELVARAGGAKVVLIGEASHGTHEFYEQRALITKRLIAEQGFAGVAAEADWPDAYRANCFARGRSDDRDADAALSGFKRFPAWMWRNTVAADFIDWLRNYNRESGRQAGFYGLDLYSMYESMEAVIRYLDRVDPEAARMARHRYSCFEDAHEDSQRYGYAASFGMRKSCEDEAVQQLADLRRQAAERMRSDGRELRDADFYAQQSARLVRNAEEYYRSMFGSRTSSWNVRDRHMAETLGHLIDHLAGERRDPKLVVWAHNSHVGDARATEMGRGGEINIGQLARERSAGDTFIIGFTTNRGEVTAASDWDMPAERKRVRPGLSGSYEALFHHTEVPRFLLYPCDAEESFSALRLQRAIGVIYRPETERSSHYFHAAIQRQFDAVLHLDETTALHPLEKTAEWRTGEPPETYPFGE